MSELDRLAEEAVRLNSVPGAAVAVVLADRVIASAAAGFADLATRTPMSADSACSWFSMTKIATATAAMVLAEGGAIDLDAPVARYLGEAWPSRFAGVRVRHLLNHSSGLRNPVPIRWVHRATDPRPDPVAFLGRLLARQRRPRFAPGTRAAYSNVGYLALGAVIGAAAGRPYEEFVRDELLMPLGMARTAFTWSNPAVAGLPRATPHHQLPRALTPVVKGLLPEGILGARTGKFVGLERFELDGAAYGGLIGPVTEAAQLIALHANGGTVNGTRVLSRSSIAAMTAVATHGKPYDLGLGWFRPHDDHSPQVEHLGGGIGYWNLLRLNPQAAGGAAVMSNSTRHWNITAFADAAVELAARNSERAPA
ncbi:MAG: serine hydrolase domain-containing protein [Streptosporangiaceae bacterium]